MWPWGITSGSMLGWMNIHLPLFFQGYSLIPDPSLQLSAGLCDLRLKGTLLLHVLRTHLATLGCKKLEALLAVVFKGQQKQPCPPILRHTHTFQSVFSLGCESSRSSVLYPLLLGQLKGLLASEEVLSARKPLQWRMDMKYQQPGFGLTQH